MRATVREIVSLAGRLSRGLWWLPLAVSACDGAPPTTELPPCEIPATGLPADLFCTGLYAQRARGDVADGVQPYTPGVVLWSDGAEKQRYLQLPDGAQINTDDLDDWQFPNGTKAWKEFTVDGKLIETRHFWKRDDGTWSSGTYIWNDDDTAAALNTAQTGTRLPSGYEIPSPKDCDKCHPGGSDHLLGVEAVALSLPGADGANLETLVANDQLTHAPLHARATFPNDATTKAAEALKYLHVNCGMACHSSRGIGQETELILRVRASELWPDGPDGDATPVDVTATDIWRATLAKTPTTASVAQHFPGALRITPGAHEQSLVWLMAHTRDPYQMPPLVSHKVDDVGTQALADWIDALEP